MMPNDNYGRMVSMITIHEEDIYTVIDDSGISVFSIQFPKGTAQSIVYDSINAMAPG